MNFAFKVLLVLIIIFSLAALCIDFYLWYSFAECEPPEYLKHYSSYLRFSRTALVPLTLWCLKSKLLEKDFIILSVAFVTAALADYFLILQNKLIIGIAIFGLFQMVLLYRHFANFKMSHVLKPQFSVPALLVFGIGIVLLILMSPGLIKVNLLWPVSIYSFLLLSSLVGSYYARFLNYLSQQKAKFAFIGMLLFVLCDITVGLGAIWKGTDFGLFIRASTTLFYTPSLIFILWSGVKKVAK